MSDKLPAVGEFLVYSTNDGQIKLEVRLEEETLWMNQQMMAELFQTTKQNIGQHLKNVFEEGELEEESVVKKSFTTAADGKQYYVNFYNLDVLISVGYRVKSVIATHFRIWATQKLTEYIIKGFVMDDERLKNPPQNGSNLPDYFDEMLDRIRDIRSSEKRMYLRAKDIFTLAADYEPSGRETTRFFRVIQNKLHYASSGMTASELIRSRANANLPRMGLTSWQKDEVRKHDVTIAKNYLKEDEIKKLNRIVTMWLDFAEDQAERRKQVFMSDWERKLDEFLKFNDRKVLTGSGKVSSKAAQGYVSREYEKYRIKRREKKEVLGAKDYIEQLETTVKKLSKKGKKIEDD